MRTRKHPLWIAGRAPVGKKFDTCEHAKDNHAIHEHAKDNQIQKRNDGCTFMAGRRP